MLRTGMSSTIFNLILAANCFAAAPGGREPSPLEVRARAHLINQDAMIPFPAEFDEGERRRLALAARLSAELRSAVTRIVVRWSAPGPARALDRVAREQLEELLSFIFGDARAPDATRARLSLLIATAAAREYLHRPHEPRTAEGLENLLAELGEVAGRSLALMLDAGRGGDRIEAGRQASHALAAVIEAHALIAANRGDRDQVFVWAQAVHALTTVPSAAATLYLGSLAAQGGGGPVHVGAALSGGLAGATFVAYLVNTTRQADASGEPLLTPPTFRRWSARRLARRLHHEFWLTVGRYVVAAPGWGGRPGAGGVREEARAHMAEVESVPRTCERLLGRD